MEPAAPRGIYLRTIEALFDYLLVWLFELAGSR